MKIKNVIDVITNSSTEVFTLKTTASLEDVSNYLKENTSGYEEPERLTKYGHILQELVDFGYIYNPDDWSSMEEYYLEHVFNKTEEYNWETGESFEIPGAKELNEAWEEHVYKNRGIINQIYREYYGWENRTDIHELLDDNKENCWFDSVRSYFLPSNFIKDFLESYKGQLPETVNLPDELNINYWIGGIGVMGTGDNSIPYETWEGINETFNGRNWHLG